VSDNLRDVLKAISRGVARAFETVPQCLLLEDVRREKAQLSLELEISFRTELAKGFRRVEREDF